MSAPPEAGPSVDQQGTPAAAPAPDSKPSKEEQKVEAARKDEEAEEKMRRQLNEAMIASRPRDALHGLGSGLATMAAGVAAGVAGLVVAPVAGAASGGVSGFAKGCAAGLAGVVVLPVGGLVTGAVQIGRGVYNTPEAITAHKEGKIWNKELGEWVEKPGNALQAYDEDAAKQRAAILGTKPKVDYYAVLELKRDASADQIKRAYFVLAKKYHPDKNPGDETAKERFQAYCILGCASFDMKDGFTHDVYAAPPAIGEAYQILGDPTRKAQYDQYGSAETEGTVNATMFFNMMFGSDLFEPLVGELSIAAMARSSEAGTELTAKQLQYQRETRIMKLLAHLADLLELHVQGQEAQFKAKVQKLADELVSASFGETMLHTLGDVYSREADVYLKNFFAATLTRFQAKKEEFKSHYAALKAATELQSYKGDLESETDTTGMTEEQAQEELAKRAVLEKKGMSLALSAMWAANRADIQTTVRSVCRRMLRDANVTAAVQEKRAKGLRELGAIFQAAKAPAHLAGDTAQFMEALKQMQEGRAGGAGPSTEAE